MGYILAIYAALQISLFVLGAYRVIDWPLYLILLPTIAQLSAFALYLAIIWIASIARPKEKTIPNEKGEEMEELSKYSEDVSAILKDIDDTYAQIKLTSSQNRKQDLWRHIEKQQRKLRKMMKRDS